jgi:hypothetical protein
MAVIELAPPTIDRQGFLAYASMKDSDRKVAVPSVKLARQSLPRTACLELARTEREEAYT